MYVVDRLLTRNLLAINDGLCLSMFNLNYCMIISVDVVWSKTTITVAVVDYTLQSICVIYLQCAVILCFLTSVFDKAIDSYDCNSCHYKCKISLLRICHKF